MAETSTDLFRVTLLGTGAPPPRLDRFGPSTLVEVGGEKLLFDAGRGALQRLFQLGIPFGEITAMFLTHHHSDHVVGFTDLWLTGWIGMPWGKRNVPLKVWGPEGTNQMAEHLPLAFATDIRVRSHSYPTDGVKLESTEIEEGVVYESGDIRVTTFKVDHGGEQLDAYGYRIDFRGARPCSPATPRSTKTSSSIRRTSICWCTRCNTAWARASSAPTWSGSAATTPSRKTPASYSRGPNPGSPPTRISCSSATPHPPT